MAKKLGKMLLEELQKLVLPVILAVILLMPKLVKIKLQLRFIFIEASGNSETLRWQGLYTKT
jgi:hypothetical protein